MAFTTSTVAFATTCTCQERIGDGGSECLLTLCPGRGVGFFVEVDRERLNPHDHMERIVEIARDYDLEFVRPPPLT